MFSIVSLVYKPLWPGFNIHQDDNEIVDWSVFNSFMEIKKARNLHKGITSISPPRIGELDVSPEGKLGF